MVAERAIELVPKETIDVLVGDFVEVPQLDEGRFGDASLLDQVRKFCEASLRGDYFDSVDVNGKHCRDQSKGTEAFIAEYDRLIRRCLGTVATVSPATAGEVFERLFALLRRIDEDPDSVIFFADEAGSWQIPVDWRMVLQVYFRWLAEGTSGETFARAVDCTIADFCNYRDGLSFSPPLRAYRTLNRGRLFRVCPPATDTGNAFSIRWPRFAGVMKQQLDKSAYGAWLTPDKKRLSRVN